MFRIVSDFLPCGDQPKAIEKLIKNIKNGEKEQVLLGATGTGKTFTMAQVIEKLQVNTLILAHNKTLVMQIYQEMQGFFPNNRVEYYVSYFDFYQPEAYKPASGVYIEKKTQRNSGIAKMRLRAVNSLARKELVIVVASVAAIYGCFDPVSYQKALFLLTSGTNVAREKIVFNLERLGYKESKNFLEDGDYQVKKNLISFSLGWEEVFYIQIFIDDENNLKEIRKISKSSPDN
jgi:excinuclease ABC subunit B